jgi:dTDP-4-dehydrorhamnose 3,5-epimerase
VEPVLRTPLRRIPVDRGDVMHAIRGSAPGFAGFGEAYFSSVHGGAVKGWKRHNRMTMNLVVAAGRVRFVIHDDGADVGDGAAFQAFELSPDTDADYARLTVPPGYWVAFTGVGDGLNLILNVASMEHDPTEADARPLDAFAWDWAR